MGIVPLIVLAGFFEGFLTRHTETPDILRAAIILFSALFIVGYFVWYPYRLSRIGFSKPLEDEKLPPTRTEPMDYRKILTIGEIFKESFSFLTQHLRIILLVAFALSVLYCGVGYFLMGSDLLVSDTVSVTEFFEPEMFRQIAILFDYTNINMFVLNIGIGLISWLFISYLLFKKINNEEENAPLGWRDFGNHIFYNILKILPIVVLLNAMAFLPIALFIIFGCLLLPIFCLHLYVMTEEQLNPFAAYSRTFYLLGNSWGKMYGLFFIISLVSLAFFILINTSIVWFYFEVIQWNFDAETSTLAAITKWFSIFLIIFIANIVIPLIIISMGLLYFSLLEVKEAGGLMERIASLGKKRRAFGLEVEA